MTFDPNLMRWISDFCDLDTLQIALAKVGYLGMDIYFMWSPSRFSHRAILEDRITLHKVVNKHVHTNIEKQSETQYKRYKGKGIAYTRLLSVEFRS